jgi:hypothetical protein
MGEFAEMFTREPKPFEREAQARVNRHLKALGHVEPNYYGGQFELKATVDTYGDLRWLADQFGGEIEVADRNRRSTWTQLFTVVQIEGVKVRVSAYVSDEEVEAHELW